MQRRGAASQVRLLPPGPTFSRKIWWCGKRRHRHRHCVKQAAAQPGTSRARSDGCPHWQQPTQLTCKRRVGSHLTRQLVRQPWRLQQLKICHLDKKQAWQRERTRMRVFSSCC